MLSKGERVNTVCRLCSANKFIVTLTREDSLSSKAKIVHRRGNCALSSRRSGGICEIDPVIFELIHWWKNKYIKYLFYIFL